MTAIIGRGTIRIEGQMTNEEYLEYAKGLDQYGIIPFCCLLLSEEARRNLTMYGNEFTVDHIISILSTLRPNVLFYKGDRIAGNIEHFLSRKDPTCFTHICNAQKYCRKVQKPLNKDRVQGLEKFWVLTRLGNGRFAYTEKAEESLQKVIMERYKFVVDLDTATGNHKGWYVPF